MIRRAPLWLALPAITGLVLFLVYPTAYLIALALTDSSLGNPLRAFTGAQNFHTAFDAPAFVPALWRSTVFALAATIATTGTGLLLALLLRARGTRFGAVGALLLLPLVTAPVLIGVAWKLLLAPVGGGLADALSAVGLAGANPLGSGVGRIPCCWRSTSGSGHRSRCSCCSPHSGWCVPSSRNPRASTGPGHGAPSPA
jgi:multiple sugar transport system permease protein